MSIDAMNNVWKHSPYDGARLLIHLAMADHADDDGRFFSAQTSLARKARCSVEYVRQTVNQMINEGALKIERKGTARGRSTEYQLAPCKPLPKSVGEDATVISLPNSSEQLPNSGGEPPNSARGQSSVQPPIQSESGASAPPPADESLNQHVNRLARIYSELVPMSKFPAVMLIVRKALAADHADDAITAALQRLAREGRSLTVETLRIELEGLPTGRQQPSRAQRAMANYQQGQLSG